MTGTTKPFNLLRWFSIVSLVVIAAISVVVGMVVSRFVVEETVQRDAMLSAQFIQNIAEAEVRHAALGPGITIGQFLDYREDGDRLGVSEDHLVRVRNEFFDHIRTLPDVLLAKVFAPDRVVVWATNPTLIGKAGLQNAELEEAFRSRVMVARGYAKTVGETSEQYFLRPPQGLYIENYIPLFSPEGEVAAVVEIYKEPAELMSTMQRAYVLLWTATLLGAAVIYLALFWIVRRAARQLKEQQRLLIENETLVALGEMSSAVAHGLRNPLATIRSSAELALDGDAVPARKNISDIISQVDRLSRWVRELLLYSRPISDEREGVDLNRAVAEVLAAFEQQIERARIEVEWTPVPNAPRVIGHGPLMTQVLNSVVSNAIEAMSKGGRLTVSLAPNLGAGRVVLTISDSGTGMTEQQLAMAFRPFHTTKRTGLGVGLALVKRIMERFDGGVQLDSREQAGTQVRLTFSVAHGE